MTERWDDIAAIADELELEAKLRLYDSHRFRGEENPKQPTLQLDDVSAIPFLDGIAGVEEYQHRARVRADSGDLFAAVTPPVAGYEDYCRGLGLGSPDLISAEPVGHPLEVARACASGEAFTAICERAAHRGGMTIHPYMGIEAVWALARAIAERAMVPVTVIGPPPPVTWIANDKVLFNRVVRAVVGDEFLPMERVVSSVEEAAAAAYELAQLCGVGSRVGMKRARCASAMGNRVYACADLDTPERASAASRAFADETAWPEGEDAIVVEWFDATSSPSTQLWIPPGRGPICLEGVYEQILAGETKVFVGSRPSTLPEVVNRRLAAAAIEVARALQSLGYVGRCSFDHLVIGDSADEPRIIFSECNGRWGGTSTPMHLVDRLRGEPRPTYRAQDVVSEKLVGIPFSEILEALGTELYSRAGNGRLVFYNTGPLASSGKLDVIAFGDTPDEADEVMLEVMPRLLGL